MRDELQDEISEDALLLFPFAKLLYQGDPKDPALVPFRNQTYPVLRALQRQGPQPISAIGKGLLIAKQNMTTVVDRLMHDGLAERQHDTGDRRVVTIVITDRGLEFLKESELGLKGIIKKNLSRLRDDDITSLHTALRTIRTIMTRIQGR
jgi:DNA-binding MarR family transcriptional regulator